MLLVDRAYDFGVRHDGMVRIDAPYRGFEDVDKQLAITFHRLLPGDCRLGRVLS